MKKRSSSERTTMVTPGYEHQSNQPSGMQLQDAALGIAASQPIPPHNVQYSDQAQFEADKRTVYKHPLFPLLALLFDKCELATQTAVDTPISDSFHHDLEAFIQHQERDRKPFLANDPEVDGLVKKIKNHGCKPAEKYWSDNLATMGCGPLEPSDGTDGLDHHYGCSNRYESSEDSDDSSNDGNDLLIDNYDSLEK